jgi:hypothetical protein
MKKKGPIKLPGFFDKPAVLSVLFALFAIWCVLSNLEWGKMIMGLDNYSPYFDLNVNLLRMFRTDTFFEFGGLAFLPWVHALVLLNVPPWIISQLFLWGSIGFGVFGSVLLIRRLVPVGTSSFRMDNEKFMITVGVIVFLLSGLVVTWMANQPNIVFLSAFAGIPGFIHFLLFFERKDCDWKKAMFWTIGILFLFASSLNIVAFMMFLVQGVIIAAAAGMVFLKTDMKTIFLRGLAVLGAWILVVQVLLLFTPMTRIVTAEVYIHFQDIKANELTVAVTDDLRASELQNNSLLNSARFATGWMELHNDDDESVFGHYSVFMHDPVLIMAGLTPLIMVIVAYPTAVKKNKRVRLLYLLLGVGILLMSRYAVMVYEHIPLVREGLRWVSSKLWPLLLYPMLMLFLFSSLALLKDLKGNVRYLLIAIVTVALMIHAFPWWTGSVVSRHAQVELPTQYEEVFSRYGEDDTILYLPLPQSSYFRRYEWGYFGSDFLRYMTKADVVDGASLLNDRVGLEGLSSAFSSCKWGYLVGNGIDRVVYDTSVSGAEREVPYCAEENVIGKEGSLIIVNPAIGEK